MPDEKGYMTDEERDAMRKVGAQADRLAGKAQKEFNETGVKPAGYDGAIQALRPVRVQPPDVVTTSDPKKPIGR